ncbi:hypothetical protein ASG89_27975 [Paenibacillus sp. Soil766]|uniref:hypothetical protein n=1 Tax=Paenibacillus sp. Soil766 TaxID=1736404 RepID=UPI00070D1DDC|nr:hypothetical protein [Paenibacillus sp. Soil766]KRE99401.1 hypothetical protein ASG89_27975 [Paenibacillus sp. Soil766]
MLNFVPYLILVAISMSSFVILLFQKRSTWPLFLLLAYSGMIYLFEFFIFVCFNSYRYIPQVVSIPYYDNAVGAIISNLLSVPVAATYITVYRLSWIWIICLAFLFGGIELLFLRLGVYEQSWWRTIYTIVALLFFFLLARKWPSWLSRGKRVFKLVTLAMFAWSIVATLVFLFALSGIRIFHIGLFQDPYHDDIFVSAIYCFIIAIILTIGVSVPRHPWSSSASLFIIFAMQIVLIRIGLLKILILLWQYWLINVSCYCIILGIVLAGNHKLEKKTSRRISSNNR